MKKTDLISMSAYATDYSDKAYKLWFLKNSYEFLPKSKATLTEAPDGIDTSEPRSCWFELPLWLAEKLKGAQFYAFL